MDGKTDSAIRSEGAEIYVQAWLMMELGIPATLASRNMPGYDVLAHNIVSGKTCRVQVKYRKAINSNGMRIKNFGFDFVVYVIGNIGKVGEQIPVSERCRKPLQVFVIPKQQVKKGVGKRELYRSPAKGGHDRYENAWWRIARFLGLSYSL